MSFKTDIRLLVCRKTNHDHCFEVTDFVPLDLDLCLSPLMASTADSPLLLSRLNHHVQTQPEKTAVSFVSSSGQIDESYTYRELDRITTQLAQRLIQKGIQPGEW